ncbi:hypothetical protein GPA22_17945 [Aromatoleum toluvorans]|uniref:Transmembrane protein n=1 Tax=Aromatoleum toluvorans TaxID=92002 RepID=A0ABX1Q1M0_9RHOO|nr:hypothetical protein [Aromatoleum toluvorans]NMG45601.1 hypothetical protein [Aromatoleum toluvorans]
MANRDSFFFTAGCPHDGERRDCPPRRRSAGTVLAMLFVCASTLAAGSGFARESALSVPASNESVTAPAYGNARDQRRAELRRALMNSSEVSRPAAQERRRLSREQRETLHRELREAMRDAERPRSVTER